MGKFLSFLFGGSLMFLVMWLCRLTTSMTTTIILSWFAGIVIGGWAIGIVMFCFASYIAEQIVYQPTRLKFQNQDIIINDDEEEDENWWRHGKKPYGEAS